MSDNCVRCVYYPRESPGLYCRVCGHAGPIVAGLNILRFEEGNSVTLLCDNPEGPPNNAIECNGEWTAWEDRRFEGESLQAAIDLAVLTKLGLLDPEPPTEKKASAP